MIMRNNPLLNATDSLTLAINDLDTVLETSQTLKQSEKEEIRHRFTVDVVSLKNHFAEALKKIQVIDQTRLILESGKAR